MSTDSVGAVKSWLAVLSTGGIPASGRELRALSGFEKLAHPAQARRRHKLQTVALSGVSLSVPINPRAIPVIRMGRGRRSQSPAAGMTVATQSKPQQPRGDRSESIQDRIAA
jgi:hypothetical protein